MSEGQVEDLQHLEEGSEAIDIPALIVFSDTTPQVEIVQNCG